jgi:hypothetical protein
VIHVFDDSDTSGAGELSFSGAVYDATVAGGARLTEPQFSAKREVDSGQDFDSPFDNLLVVDRAPSDARALDGRFTTPLAIAADPQEGLLLAALDREDRIGVCRLDDSAADFEDLGPLDELLEGPLPSVPLAPPAAA